MFEIRVDAMTKFEYELQGLFTTERIYHFLNIKTSCP